MSDIRRQRGLDGNEPGQQEKAWRAGYHPYNLAENPTLITNSSFFTSNLDAAIVQDQGGTLFPMISKSSCDQAIAIYAPKE